MNIEMWAIRHKDGETLAWRVVLDAIHDGLATAQQHPMSAEQEITLSAIASRTIDRLRGVLPMVERPRLPSIRLSDGSRVRHDPHNINAPWSRFTAADHHSAPTYQLVLEKFSFLPSDEAACQMLQECGSEL